MHILALIQILIQVFFAVHVVKTGRAQYWLWIIIFVPGIGPLVYFFAEYLPYLRKDYKVRKFAAGVEKSLNPTKQMRYLEDQLKLNPSIKNKKLLAEEYVNLGMFDKAVSLYQECMQGLYENDMSMLEGLCCAYFFSNDLANAKTSLEKLMDVRPDDKVNDFDLLYARTLENSGDISGALEAYSKIATPFPGEEARCRYALLLKKEGKPDLADELFEEILENARLSPKFYVNAQKEWIKIAGNEKR